MGRPTLVSQAAKGVACKTRLVFLVGWPISVQKASGFLVSCPAYFSHAEGKNRLGHFSLDSISYIHVNAVVSESLQSYHRG